MHQIFEWRCTRFWRGVDTDSDQDKGAIAPLGRRPSTSRTIFDTFSARIEERKGKLTATLASQFLNLHNWSTSNLRINSSSTHEEKWTCSPPLVHNTHIVGCEEILFCFFRKKSQHGKDLITYQGGHTTASYGNLQVDRKSVV